MRSFESVFFRLVFAHKLTMKVGPWFAELWLLEALNFTHLLKANRSLYRVRSADGAVRGKQLLSASARPRPAKSPREALAARWTHPKGTNPAGREELTHRGSFPRGGKSFTQRRLWTFSIRHRLYILWFHLHLLKKIKSIWTSLHSSSSWTQKAAQPELPQNARVGSPAPYRGVTGSFSKLPTPATSERLTLHKHRCVSLLPNFREKSKDVWGRLLATATASTVTMRKLS